ncbi:MULTISPECIES: hypothetical protein [Niastella]|uniref:Uncharacterized protein n=1 Tax=Niastella soli TaxID=2821487 RepID=A0ABS3Z319_9BACT|nr:hypothetical protein [Niastella soli]MBO9204554.1 hypothetical protein [Niastella soli]
MWTLSSDYINNLSFHYIETYSFRRGSAYEKLNAENADLEYNGYIEDENGQFFPYSIRTGTFQHDHPIAIQVKNLLQIEIEHHEKYLCAPVYRDAIIFYDQTQRSVSSLNICLSCCYMQTDIGLLKADYKTYGYLKKLFLELGHDVENPEYNIIDDIEAMKTKIKKPKR